jgi:CspA family cold shock protein
MDEPKLGRVKWYCGIRGYGFITADDGRDIFVHWTGIAYQGGNQRRTLSAGARVNFRIVQTGEGFEAHGVRVARE